VNCSRVMGPHTNQVKTAMKAGSPPAACAPFVRGPRNMYQGRDAGNKAVPNAVPKKCPREFKGGPTIAALQ
jgi:hypothetical protein